MLYSYRSVSKALPMVQADTSPDVKSEIHNGTFRILRPEILKVRAFMAFQAHAVKVVKENLTMLVSGEKAKAVPPEALLEYLVLTIDMLDMLDALKDMKASLLNDFSRYKRAFAPIRTSLPNGDELSGEIHHLQMFLGNPQQPHNLIIYHLKQDIQQVPGFELVLLAMVSHCLNSIETGQVLLPRRLHGMTRVLPTLIYLMDKEPNAIGQDISDKKGINAFKLIKPYQSRLTKMFKARPVVPLYGDMTLDVLFVLRRCKNWDKSMESLWSSTDTKRIANLHMLSSHIDKIRQQYNECTTEVAARVNEINEAAERRELATPKLLEKVLTSVIKSVRYLSHWSTIVKEQCAWKYSHPCPEKTYRERGGRGGASAEYEKVVKYNYSNAELYLLVDVAGMIKGLGTFMERHAVSLVPMIRGAIHDLVQTFLQSEVVRPLRKAHKKGRKSKAVMLAMREIAGDFMEGANKEDYLNKKKVLLTMEHEFPRRTAAPTVSQITLIRRMAFTIFSARATGMSVGVFNQKDLKKEWLPVWQKFYDDSYFFADLLRYKETIHELMDLSHLWYREFYLEMTKCVQFPIGMSMPWIMTQFLIDTPAMKENIFFPMDIYNDAASRALNDLRQQFLYDEIEAELNLSFDQLVFHLSEDIFKYYKTVASSVLIDKKYEAGFNYQKQRSRVVPSSRYGALMAQRQVNLLGRFVDLKKLVSQHVGSYLRRNVNHVIRKFESQDLTAVIELDMMLQNLRLTHDLMSEHLVLDPFADILGEINEDVGLGEFRGRIVWHVFSELVYDIIPAFVYNSSTRRFMRGISKFVEPMQRESAPKAKSYFWYGRGFKEAFERRTHVFRGHLGHKHIESLLNVLSEGDVPLIVHELMNDIENKILYDLHPYTKILSMALPAIGVPKIVFGSLGGYSFYEMKLKNSIAGYEALRSGLFQKMKEIGNAMCFLSMLDVTVAQRHNLRYVQSSFFLGVTARPAPDAPNVKAILNAGQKTDVRQLPQFVKLPGIPPYNTLLNQNLAAIEHRYKSDIGKEYVEDIKRSAQEASAMYEYGGGQHSLMTAVLNQLSHALSEHGIREEWLGKEPQFGEIVETENPQDFVRLFSALQFLFCQSPMQLGGEEPIHDIETFGDGWSMAGCLVVHLLGRRRRFELLDFTYNILRMDQIKPINRRGKPKRGEEQLPYAADLLTNTEWVKGTNDAFFSMLESFWNWEDEKEGEVLPAPTAASINPTMRRITNLSEAPRGSSSARGAAPRDLGSPSGAQSFPPGVRAPAGLPPGVAPPSGLPPGVVPPPGAPPGARVPRGHR